MHLHAPVSKIDLDPSCKMGLRPKPCKPEAAPPDPYHTIEPSGPWPRDKDFGRIQYTTWEASPEQVSGPGGVYISPRELGYSLPSAQGAVSKFPTGNG